MLTDFKPADYSHYFHQSTQCLNDSIILLQAFGAQSNAALVNDRYEWHYLSQFGASTEVLTELQFFGRIQAQRLPWVREHIKFITRIVRQRSNMATNQLKSREA
jgi:hypothetical protein